MSERQSVEIDYCPECRGVWLDRGEIDKLIAGETRAIAPPPAPTPATGTATDGYRGHDQPGSHETGASAGRDRGRRKRDGLLDLLDFG
jgi:Zn-finger nucleic acid-binding protein